MSVKVWSAKIQTNGLATSDPNFKKDAEFQLQQMMRELELKQKQLLKLLQARD